MHYKEYKSVLSAKNGMNIYRGCTHGCIYCDSRSLCYQMDHDFEDVEVKQDAPLILESQLLKRRKKCMIGTGAMCDPYMHCEKELMNMRKCLQVIDKYGFGVALQTKSDLVLRDIDLLKSIQKKAKCVVQMTLTTYDEALCRIVEPNVCTTAKRFETLKVLRDNGIPTVVWLSPVLPFINDTRENIQGILNDCFEAEVKGILCFGMGLTLRDGNREYFYRCLDQSFPGMKEKYIEKFGNSFQIASDRQRELMQLFYAACRQHNVMCGIHEIFNYLYTFEEKNVCSQMNLFDS